MVEDMEGPPAMGGTSPEMRYAAVSIKKISGRHPIVSLPGYNSKS